MMNIEWFRQWGSELDDPETRRVMAELGLNKYPEGGDEDFRGGGRGLMSAASNIYGTHLERILKELQEQLDAMAARKRELPIERGNFAELDRMDTEECIIELLTSGIKNVMADVVDIEKAIKSANRELRLPGEIKRGMK